MGAHDTGRGGDNRDKLLATGLELLTRQGYAATGVQEITNASGVPKGSFYNYFDSKEEFAIEVLRRYQEQACGQLYALLADRGRPPLERLAALFEALGADFAAGGFEGGCLAGRLAQELAGETPAFRAPVAWTFDCMQGAIADTLRDARARGDLAGDDDPDDLAQFLFNSWQGAAMRAKAAHSRQPLDNFIRLAFRRLLPAAGGAAG